MTDDSIHPFRVAIPGADLDDLHQRLDRTRWPDELSDVGWAYGIPRDYLMELARYWRHEYDWRAAEERLNAWPQFTTTIDSARLCAHRFPGGPACLDRREIQGMVRPSQHY